MADNVPITSGSGTNIATDDVAGVHYQRVKLVDGTLDSAVGIPGDAANGLDVDVTRVQGTVNVADGGASLTTDTPQLPAALVGGRLDVNVGASAALPVTDNAGSLTVDTLQLPGALVGGRLDVNVGASAALPVTDNGGSLTVDSAQLPGALVGGRLDVQVGAALPSGTNLVGAVKLRDPGGVNEAAVTAAGAVKVDGSAVTQPVSGTVAATKSGAWNIDSVVAAVTVQDGGGTISVDDGAGSLTVDGTVSATQGTAAANAGAWPVKISDGTSTAGLSNVGGQQALKVDVIQAVGSSAQTDKSAFTEGSAKFEVVGGVYNETIASDPAEDQAAAARITAKRAVHVNVRKADGTEIGVAAAPVRTDPTGTTTQPVSGTVTASIDANTNAGASKKQFDLDTGAGADNVVGFAIALPASGGAVAGGTQTNPVRTDPTGTTTQPVSGTVTANQGAAPWAENITQIAGSAIATASAGIPKVGLTDEAGGAYSHANPLQVELVPHSESSQVRKANTYAPSETDIAIWTPTGGKKFVVLGVIITVSGTGAGAVFKIFDNTNAAANMLYQGTPPVGVHQIQFATPWSSAAINNVLRYSTGTNANGDVTVYGYEV